MKAGPNTPKRTRTPGMDWRTPKDRRKQKTERRMVGKRLRPILPVLTHIAMPTVHATGATHPEKQAQAQMDFFIRQAHARRIPIRSMGQVLRDLGNRPEQARAFFRDWTKKRYPMVQIPKKLLDDATLEFMRTQYAREEDKRLRRP